VDFKVHPVFPVVEDLDGLARLEESAIQVLALELAYWNAWLACRVCIILCLPALKCLGFLGNFKF
jgi:hypothetical protein